MTARPGSPSRDFLLEVMKDSQPRGRGYLAERERWLRRLPSEGREEVLFELEMLLRGIERYFNLHNLPIEDQGSVVAHDFKEELRAVRDAVHRSIKLARFLLDAPSDGRMMFRQYLQSRTADDRLRRQMIEAEIEQATPQDSLFLLRSSFSALRGILDGLLCLESANYQLFCDVGQVALRQIALNKYFQTFRALEFRAEYDRIKSIRVLELLKDQPEEARKPLSLAFLSLFRLLRYLQYVPGPGDPPLRRAHVVLALVRSEAFALAAYVGGELPSKLARLGIAPAAAAAKVAGEIEGEGKIIALRELGKSSVPPPEAVARAKEAFEKLCQQAMVGLMQGLQPGVRGEELFDNFVSRREQSLRLRLDLFAFRELCQRAARELLGPTQQAATQAIAGLKHYLAYFRDVSYQLLRYGDYEPFDRFAAIVAEIDEGSAHPAARARLADDCSALIEVLERTYKSVSARRELAELPFDAAEGRRLAERFFTQAA